MNQKFRKLAIFVPITVAIYLTIATVLILAGKPKAPDVTQSGINISEMFFDYSGLPQLQSYVARDQTRLTYRHYPATSDKIVILIHGSGWHSQQFLPLANFISSQGLAQVYTPDLRGHGASPKRRGDIDYIGQFEHDLADFIGVIKQEHPNAMLVIGGHSSGGGLAIRFAGGEYGALADAYVLLAPFVYYNAPTTRPNAGGWAQPYTSFAPRNYEHDLSAMTQPLFVVAGTADETMFAQQYEAVISKYADVEVKLLPDVTHMGVVVGTKVQPVIGKWLQQLQKY
ncbi:MAG: alpha/beta fold hydrolase [Gammaproteobacteria bacterium]|nr:alpha/beta fold hydrolase [Gammaproteobacteria bacterium]